MKYQAIVLAGGLATEEIQQNFSIKNKSLIEINKKSMLDHVLLTIEQTKSIDSVILVGQKNNNFNHLIINYIDDQGSLIKNLLTGFSVVDQDKSVIVITADIPLIRSEHIERLIIQAELEPNTQIFYPIIEKENYQNKFKNNQRTFFTLKEGSFTGGNLFIVKIHDFAELENTIEKILEARKQPLKIASIIGFKTAFKFLTKTLTIPEVEQTVLRTFKINGRVLIAQDPEIGFDVDKLSDVEFVQNFLDNHKDI